MVVEFYVPKDDQERAVIESIANRSVELGIHDNQLDALMDLSATMFHMPLRVYDLFAADDFNFAHDLGGIARHLDRTTGNLLHAFLPRYAAPQAAPVEAEAVTT